RVEPHPLRIRCFCGGKSKFRMILCKVRHFFGKPDGAIFLRRQINMARHTLFVRNLGKAVFPLMFLMAGAAGWSERLHFVMGGLVMTSEAPLVRNPLIFFVTQLALLGEQRVSL